MAQFDGIPLEQIHRAKRPKLGPVPAPPMLSPGTPPPELGAPPGVVIPEGATMAPQAGPPVASQMPAPAPDYGPGQAPLAEEPQSKWRKIQPILDMIGAAIQGGGAGSTARNPLAAAGAGYAGARQAMQPITDPFEAMKAQAQAQALTAKAGMDRAKAGQIEGDTGRADAAFDLEVRAQDESELNSSSQRGLEKAQAMWTAGKDKYVRAQARTHGTESTAKISTANANVLLSQIKTELLEDERDAGKSYWEAQKKVAEVMNLLGGGAAGGRIDATNARTDAFRGRTEAQERTGETRAAASVESARIRAESGDPLWKIHADIETDRALAIQRGTASMLMPAQVEAEVARVNAIFDKMKTEATDNFEAARKAQGRGMPPGVGGGGSATEDFWRQEQGR